MSRLAWTDPAPLEVERPRLPWWTLLPRKLLLAVSPIIAVVVVVTVVVFVARRVWRYPLFVIGATVLTDLGFGYSWWAPIWLATGLAVVGGSWAWAHPDSFDRTVVRQVRSQWRRAVIYAWPWKRVILFSDLTKRTGHHQRSTHYPTLRRVRSDGWRDRVSVKLLHGQCADTYVAHAAELANSFRAHSCRVRVDKPRRIWLDLVHTDPLAQPIKTPALADPGTAVDLARVVVLLDSLRAHLTAFELPELCSVHVTRYASGPNVTAQLASRRESPEIASALLAWAETLTDVTAEAWRVPGGDSVHLSVTGRLPSGASTRVYGGVPFTAHGLGADLAPDTNTTVALAVLREQATIREVTL